MKRKPAKHEIDFLLSNTKTQEDAMTLFGVAATTLKPKDFARLVDDIANNDKWNDHVRTVAAVIQATIERHH